MSAGGRPEAYTKVELELAAYLAVTRQFVSTSMLQRFLRIGYARALAVLAALESKGVVGPVQTGTSVRDVLWGPDRVTDIFDALIKGTS